MTPRSEIQRARAAGKAVRARTRRPGSSALGAVALTLCFLPFASTALAGPPIHPRQPTRDISGFNHACGTAVDSKGDVYVSSAGESKVKIFNPAHAELTFIPNANEPCGLAVDSKGALYVSEKATGKVVRYAPNAYPFSGTPTYGAPVTIDASGAAKGISVDPLDDRLYVAEGGRISTFDSEGGLGIDEKQRALVFEATGGTFKLSFKGQETGPIAWDATHATVQSALEGLSTIGAGNVSVTEGPNKTPRDHLVAFEGPLAHTDVEALTADASGLIGGTLIIEEKAKGFNGHIGEGDLTTATGVAAYTYKASGESSGRYLFAADTSTDQVEVFSGFDIRNLKLRKEIAGPKSGEDFGFGTAGAYLDVDPGNGNSEGKCSALAEQACTAGHFLVYDGAHEVVDEFEANGEFLDQISSPAFADAEPTGLAVERSGGSDDGAIYVTAGSGAGAVLLAFGPLATPSRPPLSELSHLLATARGVATDPEGDAYVAAGPLVHVYGPTGKEIKVGTHGNGIEVFEGFSPDDVAVDSTGKVYTLVNVNSGNRATEKVQYYMPASYPPHDGTQYSGPITVATGNSFLNSGSPLSSIGINPANDHVFVANHSQIIELDSAKEGSPILNSCFACDFGLGAIDVAAYGANGDVYVSEQLGTIFVVDPTGTEILTRISGAGGSKGSFGFGTSPGKIGVDQSNGHVLVFKNSRGAGEEYDASGAFVAEFGTFTDNISRTSGIAIDNSGGPSSGNVYIAFDDPAPETFDLTAFGPLTYGEVPVAVTGIASGLDAGDATLHGAVDPRGFEVEDCHFEYLTDAQYISNGKTFAGATSEPCAESSAEIGKSTGPVPVHADLSGLDPEARYRFRLLATNKYGEGEGKAGLFGPPILIPESPLPILYDEATLRSQIDPSGLATKYRFEYGTSEGYGQSTPVAELAPGDGAVAVQVPLTGLAEGTEYHFRILVENEAKAVSGPDQTLVTLQRAKPQKCENTEFRTGLSASLPDCRAYELVTPTQAVPAAAGPGTTGQEFNNWLVTPRGEGAGESLAYFSGTLPGFNGTGETDGFRAHRAPGAHPAEGWASELFSPSYAQVGGGGAGQHGVASDQRYWLFSINNFEIVEGGFLTGNYLRTPSGFEPIGQGSLPPHTDLEAESRYVSAGGAHVIFFSKAHLEEDAAPKGAEAIYDRAAGASSAEVVSIRPDGASFGATENATYLGATEDGSAVVFSVGGALYLHREGTTVEIAAAPNTFAGIAEDGKRVFYMDATFAGSDAPPAELFACEVEAGPCAGPGAHAPTQIAPESVFVNISPDGSRVFFTSEEALPGAEPNEHGETAEPNEHNLFAWDDSGTRFVAILDPQDFKSFDGDVTKNLLRWASSITAGVGIGRSNSPTRSTPDGEVFVFQSHAQLTSYDNGGHGEIYRYEPAAPGGELICVSCDPSGAPASADALLQIDSGGVTRATTLIPNLTDDGQEVFLQSPDRLLPEDANDTQDVYEWKAQGTQGCERVGGCLALISSGQGEEPSYLFAMSADGHDVFFETPEKLVGADIASSPSMYDARVEGGIPDPPAKAPCQGDACQGQGSTPPALPAPASTGSGNGNVTRKGSSRCSKGKRRVKGRCVRKHHKRKHGKHRRANQDGRAAK